MIVIDEEFKNLIPPLSAEEFQQLEENCVREGIRDALIVWPQEDGTDILIDGHNRWAILGKHINSLQPQFRSIQFEDREEAKEWIIRNQFGRRNLSAYDRSLLALKLKPMIAEKAKEKMLTAPQKKAEREKEIQKIWDSHDFETARNLVAMKNQEFAKEDKCENDNKNKYIYFAIFDKDKVKVGSSIDPETRIKQLSVSCPGIKLIEKVLFGEDAEKHENAIKRKFDHYRIGNECYECSESVLKEMISFTKKEASRKDNTDYQLAKVAGVSHDTIHKVEKIQEKASEQDKADLRAGTQSINQVYNKIKEPPLTSMHSVSYNIQQEKREAIRRHDAFEEKKNGSGVLSMEEIQQDKKDKQVSVEETIKELKNAISNFSTIITVLSEDKITEAFKEMSERDLLTVENNLYGVTRTATKLLKLTTEVKN